MASCRGGVCKRVALHRHANLTIALAVLAAGINNGFVVHLGNTQASVVAVEFDRAVVVDSDGVHGGFLWLVCCDGFNVSDAGKEVKTIYTFLQNVTNGAGVA